MSKKIALATGAMIVIAGLIVCLVPLREVPYFKAEQFSYEALSYIERGQPGERFERMVLVWSEDGTELLDISQKEYICPYPFPIGRVIIKNTEIPPLSEESAFSEEDEARLAILTEQFERMSAFYGQHFKPGVWEEKPIWERWGREILAAIPLSSVWGRYIPAFEYGFTPEDARSHSMQVATEMAALKSKKEATSSAIFTVYFTFNTPEETYSGSDGIGLMPGEVATVEYRVYEINMDEDEWTWEYDVSPDTKWVARYKKVSLLDYWLHY